MIPGTTSLDSTLEFVRLCIVVLDREAVQQYVAVS